MRQAAQPRQRILKALMDVLADRDWQSVGIRELAVRSGVSRQTVYNLFGSRAGLASALVEELLDRLIKGLGDRPLDQPGEAEDALVAGFEGFFAALARGRVPPRGLTDDAAVIDHATRRLAIQYQRRLPGASTEETTILARAVTRICLSYISSPPTDDPSRELARVFAPYVEAAVTRHRSR